MKITDCGLLNIANLITILRVVLVPVIVWALMSEQMMLAFLVFVIAGISDAIDGAIARYLDQQTEFGTILDPIADKIMLVSVFILLSYLEYIPLWLTILIVSRDLLIVLGIMLAYTLNKPVTIKPLWISKANTLVQIVLAAFALGILAFDLEYPNIKTLLIWLTALLTALSAMAYIRDGLKLFASSESNTTIRNTDKGKN